MKYMNLYGLYYNHSLGGIGTFCNSSFDGFTGIFFSESLGSGEAFLFIESEGIIFSMFYLITEFFHFGEQLIVRGDYRNQGINIILKTSFVTLSVLVHEPFVVGFTFALWLLYGLYIVLGEYLIAVFAQNFNGVNVDFKMLMFLKIDLIEDDVIMYMFAIHVRCKDVSSDHAMIKVEIE